MFSILFFLRGRRKISLVLALKSDEMQIDCLHIHENDEGWVVSVSVSALIERESLSVLVRRSFVFSFFWIVLRA